MQEVPKIMLIAGEASGDAHGARLVEALRNKLPAAVFFGCAGKLMRDSGVEASVQADGLSIMGLPEIAAALPMFIRTYRKLVATAVERKPDVVILIDFPEFNLKLARSLSRKGFKVVYFISPQLWGWRQYRRRTIRDHVDKLLTILPFEKDWYAERGIDNVEYVGNPLAGEVKPSVSKEQFCLSAGLDPKRPIIAFLSGSRRKEVSKILPLMLQAAAIMSEKERSLQFAISIAPMRGPGEIKEIIAKVRNSGIEVPEQIAVVSGQTYDLLNAADAAAVASGTATLETGMIGTPLVVVYKASGFNFRLVRPLIKVEHFGLINLIAGKRIAAELIQDDFTPTTLANELFTILEPETNMAMRKELRTAADQLGKGGASERAAEVIVNLIKDK